MQINREDILSRFLQVTENDPTYIRDIILNFIIAGKDTTATTIAWFIYMVCKHPAVQEKISEEVKEATNMEDITNYTEFAASLNEEALGNMHYLHAAITETLRLYPAVPVVREILTIGIISTRKLHIATLNTCSFPVCLLFGTTDQNVSDEREIVT